MKPLSYNNFLKTLPPFVTAELSAEYSHIRPHQPFRWIIQFYDDDKRLHYELSRITRLKSIEIGLHFESRDKQLNQFLLTGFQRHLFEIRDQLGDGVEVEAWDRGWSKVYELLPEQELTEDFQRFSAERLAQTIEVCHPILNDLRRAYRSQRRSPSR
jgi:hypothetical protein